MIPEPLVQLEIALRQAVESQCFEEVERLVPRYCRSASDLVTSLAPGSVCRGEIAAQARELLDWSNLMLLVARAGIADQLAPLPMISRYLRPDDRPPQMRIEA